MFNYVYLNKSKNLIDIRLKTPINSSNFHQLMENLGLVNMVLVLCWELDIKFIKIDDIVGEIAFAHNYSSYNIHQYFESVGSNTNYIDLTNGKIKLVYQGKTVEFSSGFLNWKAKEFDMYKAKIRPDVILSNGSIPNKERKDEIFKKLGSNSKSFAVLAADSDQNPGAYKIFAPDTFNKNELKYVALIEKIKAPHIIKPKKFKTRSYSILIYTFDGHQYKPSDIIYLSGTSNLTTNLRSADTEFQSMLYNCLPTPKFAKKELDRINEHYKESDELYRDGKNKTRAIAIDPPGSRDKDDAISFNIVYAKGKPSLLEMFVHISDVPPILNQDYNKYHFYYGLHKLETDYMLGCRYPMIDANLSESTNSISLIGPEKRSYTLKTTYRYKPESDPNKYGRYVFDIPEKVEMYLEKNIKVFATTYESIATSTTDYTKDLPESNRYVVHHKLTYGNKPISTLNPIPCESVEHVDINGIKWENPKDIKSTDDKEYLQTQLDNLTSIYGTLIRSLSIVQEIKPMIHTKQYSHDDYQYDLREEWVHRLIEITALESNKYAALVLYDKIKNKNFGVNNKTIGKLTTEQIKTYNDYFSSYERFVGEVPDDEGIFRGLYYGVRGHNDSPKYVREKYNRSLPVALTNSVKPGENVLDLPNLYLKFQMEKTNEIMTPVGKILGSASFNQATENLGVALYSTAIRPHLNAKLYYYTFFTSPMRRIVDCFVQYCLISDEDKVKKSMGLFKTKLLNRTDINAQCEKYNLYVSVCNKIFKGDNPGEFETYYIKYGNESFNNIFLPGLDITLTVSNKISGLLQQEGKIKLKFNQITEVFGLEPIKTTGPVTVEQLMREQKELYFQKEAYPKKQTHNYNYLNYKYLN